MKKMATTAARRQFILNLISKAPCLRQYLNHKLYARYKERVPSEAVVDKDLLYLRRQGWIRMKKVWGMTYDPDRHGYRPQKVSLLEHAGV